MPQAEILLGVSKLRKSYARASGVFADTDRGQRFIAVDDVSFAVAEGETLAIVGESGCGKTTLARMVMRLIEPDSGEIVFAGRKLLTLPSAGMRQRRGAMKMLFPDTF